MSRPGRRATIVERDGPPSGPVPVEAAERRRRPSRAPADWHALVRPCAPGEEAKAEEGVRLAYAAAGLRNPEIVWHDGPVSLAGAWGRTAGRERVGANASRLVWTGPCKAEKARLRQRSEPAARSLDARFIRDPWRIVGAAIEAAVLEAVGDVRPPLLMWLSERGRLRGLLHMGRRPTFGVCGIGPYDLAAATLLADAEEEALGHAGPALRSPVLRGLAMIAENAGWLLPHTHVCWLSRRPTGVATNGQFRLHATNGPALRYGGDWAFHAWNGAEVPRWIIDEPHRISVPWIDAEIDPKVRHAMIELMTPASFVASGGAHRVANDDSGTLWRRVWSYRGVEIDRWAGVEIGDGSGRVVSVPADVATPTAGLDRVMGVGKTWASF